MYYQARVKNGGNCQDGSGSGTEHEAQATKSARQGNQCSILQIIFLWIVVPSLICFIDKSMMPLNPSSTITKPMMPPTK